MSLSVFSFDGLKVLGLNERAFGRVLTFTSRAGCSGALCLMVAGAAFDVCAGRRVRCWKLERGLGGQERQPPAERLKLAGWRSCGDHLVLVGLTFKWAIREISLHQ